MKIEDIKEIKQSKFTKLINEAIKIKALEYLLKLRGSKGSEIQYKEIKMADYLMPSEENLTISDKRYIFAIRNRMIQIPNNFPTKNKNIEEKCRLCGEKEVMKHLYDCKWNSENENVKFEKIYGDNIKNMKKVYNQFKSKYEDREKYLNFPCDPICDPLFSCELSNGNKLTN